MRATFIEIDGIPTRYFHAGAGFPILLLHGVGMAADSWVKNIPALAERYAVFAPDLLGSGFTGAGPAGPEAPQRAIVKHLTKLIDRLVIERFAVVGSSLGGLIATLLYFTMPERVRALAVVGSAALLAAPPAELRAVFEASYRNGIRAFADNSLATNRQRLTNIVVDPASLPEAVLMMQLCAYALPGAREAYERRLQGLIASLDGNPTAWVSHRLSDVHAPMLAIAGREDPRTNPTWEAAAMAKVPHGRAVTIDGCGHFPHLEHPDAFHRLIFDFLGTPARG